MLETFHVMLREVADFATRIMLSWPGSEEKYRDTKNLYLKVEGYNGHKSNCLCGHLFWYVFGMYEVPLSPVSPSHPIPTNRCPTAGDEEDTVYEVIR